MLFCQISTIDLKSLYVYYTKTHYYVREYLNLTKFLILVVAVLVRVAFLTLLKRNVFNYEKAQ